MRYFTCIRYIHPLFTFFVGAVSLSVITGGIVGAVVGGKLIGLGSTFMTNPIGKKLSGERMTALDFSADAAIGMAAGAITGGIGAGGSALSKGATGIARIGIRGATGAASGLVGETARAISGEEVSVGSYAKSILVGTASGAIGGASSQNASKACSQGVAKVATRVAVQSVLGPVTSEICKTEGDLTKIEPKRLFLKVANKATIAAVTECSRCGTIAFMNEVETNVEEE